MSAATRVIVEGAGAAILIAGLLLLPACDGVRAFLSPPDRCEALRADLAACADVDTLPLPCDDLTTSDVENLELALDNLGCESVVHLLPLDGDPLAVSCRLFGEGCVPPRNTLAAPGGTRHPIVLVNGIDASALFSWSERIVDVLAERGHDVHLAVLPPYDAPPYRSLVLWHRVQEIMAETGAAKVNLICHSLGGLDCRYLVSEGGTHWDVDESHAEIVDAVASVTTVSTAHHGTRVADIALGYLSGIDPAAGIDSLATTLGAWFTQSALEDNVDLRASIAALSESETLAFNDLIVDAPGILYQSWAGFSRPHGDSEDRSALEATCRPTESDFDGDGLGLYSGADDHLALPLVDTYALVEDGDTGHVPNDGLCPVASARWGRFRGCVPADHMEQLGRRNLPDANVRTGIDIAWFYAAMAADLKAQGL